MLEKKSERVDALQDDVLVVSKDEIDHLVCIEQPLRNIVQLTVKHYQE